MSSPASHDVSQKRSYEDANDHVKNHYRLMRTYQTHAFATRMREAYRKPAIKMTLWEAMEKLDDFKDLSDPDLSLPNIHHLYQAAAYARDHGFPPWMVIAALLHDLGKVIYLRGKDEEGTTVETQWAVVGDTWVTGCALPPCLVYPEFNSLNPDMADPGLSSPQGIYSKGQGMLNLTYAFNHDVYMADILEAPVNRAHHSLPQEAIDVIRLHSCYPFFDKGAYKDLMGPGDDVLLENLQAFNQCDLYSKTDKVIATLDMIKEEFGPLLGMFFDGEALWF